MDLIASFLPGRTLLDFSCTCVDLWRRVDERSKELWKRVVRSDPALDPECTARAYDHDWRALYLDRNKKNHTLLLEFAVTNFARQSGERLYSSWTTHEGFAYRLLVDPLGNLLAGVPTGSTMSAYVECRPEPVRTHWGRVIQFRLSSGGTEWWSSTIHLQESVSTWGSHGFIPCTTLTAKNSPYVRAHDGAVVVRCRLQFPHVRVHIAGTPHTLDCPLAWSLQDVRQILQVPTDEQWWCGIDIPTTRITPEKEIQSLYTLRDELEDLDSISTTLTIWPERVHHVFLRHVMDMGTEWVSTTLSIPTILTLWPDAEIQPVKDPVIIFLPASQQEIQDRLRDRLGRVGHIDRSWALHMLTRLYPDIPAHRIYKVLNEDHASVHNAVRYILQGRHLGYICDGCATLDFIGTRHHCTVCEDYDLCDTCVQGVSRHRYDAKRRRIFPYLGHTTTHPVETRLIG